MNARTTHLTIADRGTVVTMSYERLGRFEIQQFLRPFISRHYVQALSSLKLAAEGWQPAKATLSCQEAMTTIQSTAFQLPAARVPLEPGRIARA